LALAPALAAAMRHKAGKAFEFGRENAFEPPVGASAPGMPPAAMASTPSEANVSANTGALEASRSDAAGRALTTNQGVAIADNQNSLKAGLRGPTLLEDFILREKI
jgi:catalase